MHAGTDSTLLDQPPGDRADDRGLQLQPLDLERIVTQGIPVLAAHGLARFTGSALAPVWRRARPWG